MADTTKTPEVHVDVHGLNAPAISKAGVGARTLQEIKQGVEQKPKLGAYHDSSETLINHHSKGQNANGYSHTFC